MTPKEQKSAARRDACFIQEIINDLDRHGHVRGGKADQMLRDWSAELMERGDIKDAKHLRRIFREKVGIENW